MLKDSYSSKSVKCMIVRTPFYNKHLLCDRSQHQISNAIFKHKVKLFVYTSPLTVTT